MSYTVGIAPARSLRRRPGHGPGRLYGPLPL